MLGSPTRGRSCIRVTLLLVALAAAGGWGGVRAGAPAAAPYKELADARWPAGMGSAGPYAKPADLKVGPYTTAEDAALRGAIGQEVGLYASPARPYTTPDDLKVGPYTTADGAAATPAAASVRQRSASTAQTEATVLRVTDETGRAVEIRQPVRRIVSLAPSLTETLFALGMGDRIVGDTDFCDYPPEALSKPHVGGVLNPNLETIAALHPDLVLATRSINRQDTVTSLERLHIPVYATDPRSVEQVLASTARLGQLLGAGDRGDAVVAGLRKRLADLSARLAGVTPTKVFFVVWQDPPISVGRDTFLADALTRAGARSVIDAKQDWPNVSLETIVQSRPDFLVYASDDAEQTRRQIDELPNRPGWRDLEAVRKKRIVVVSEGIDHTSPRLVDAIEQLARALHPERFAGAAPEGSLGGV